MSDVQDLVSIRSGSAAAVDFYGMTRTALAGYLESEFGEAEFRSTQLFEWIYRRSILDVSAMSNISRSLREKLAGRFSFPEAQIRDRQISRDGTRKYLFEVENGDKVESVMIKQPARMTLCVSSQVGCGMGCAFCRTATMGFRRNLSASEIVRQVLGVTKDAVNFGDGFDNIVFMGMGEPLHNFKGVTDAIRILTDEQGLRIPPRKITVSSVGLVPAIRKFGEADLNVHLAVSLNATTDEVRSKIMPVNKAFNIEELMKCLRAFPVKPRRKITIEYVMLSEVNDTIQDLERLPKLLRGIQAMVNLIPYNENAGLGYRTPPRERVHEWQNGLNRKGVHATVRWSKGSDIKAACGQLATAGPKESRNGLSAELPT